MGNYTYSDVVGPGWSIDFHVSNATALDGWGDSARTIRLKAGVSIKLSGSSGSMSWNATEGDQRFVIEADVVRHYLNDVLQDARPNVLGSGILIGFEAKAENSQGTMESPAQAELTWNTVTFSPTK